MRHMSFILSRQNSMSCVSVFTDYNTAGSESCRVRAFLSVVLGALCLDENMKAQKSAEVLKLETASVTI